MNLADAQQMVLPPDDESRPLRLSMTSYTPEVDADGRMEQSRTRTMPLGRVVAFVIALALIAHFLWPEGSIRHAEGVLVNAEPYQGPPTVDPVWEHEGYTFTSLAEIVLEARVLSKKHYLFGREADVSSYDLALGWGSMSDQYVLDRMKVSQSGRWYFLKYEKPPPMATKLMFANSGNFHIVAANDQVLDTVAGLRRGDVIYLRGQLVRINSSDGWTWQSSLSRTDRGGGSCELVWVEEIEVYDVAP